MHRRTLLQAAGSAALLQSGAVRSEQGVQLPPVNAPLALPDMPLLDGGLFRASDAAGQVLVLYWWASWCPFCAEQSPHIQKLWEAQRARGLKVLGMAVDSQPAPARQYLDKRGYTFPSGFYTPAIGKVLPRPGKVIPVTYVRGRDGRLLMAEAGQLFPEDVQQIARFL